MNNRNWRESKRPHGNSILDSAMVAEIRELKGLLSTREAAELFHVGKSTILDIWNGKTWRDR